MDSSLASPAPAGVGAAARPVARGRVLEVDAVLDGAPMGALLWRVLLLCACVALLDGFDTLAITYVAPAIAAEWGLQRAVFGPIFAAHYVGAAIGAALFGPFADRAGRRPAILLSTAMFAVFALATPLAGDTATLATLRALTGIGLGGALSNVIALVSEFAPARARATLVSLLYAAFPLGGVLGAPLSAWLLQAQGWGAVFIVGGLLPLALLPLLALGLPESLRFLVARGAAPERVAALAQQLAPGAGYGMADRFVARQGGAAQRPGLRMVFVGALGLPSLLLGAAAFTTQLVIVYIINWMPTLLQANGLPLRDAILTSAAFSLGGIAGSLLLARAIDRRKSYAALVLAFVGAALAIAAIGLVPGQRLLLVLVVALAGGTVVGAQVNLSAYGTVVYPTEVRATGMGWLVGIGRVGAVMGALVGSAFLALGLPLAWQYTLAGVVALATALLVQAARRAARSA
ncbi:MFS transporter [Pseudorhodoferax sp.]|uniref:MFS transporter n=1 Tax=Pseudorhodoferax sp. TaxID=1993553 RepID=UPI002DD69550|nr:MFS transporter [Pseudorhodoferax sp.]